MPYTPTTWASLPVPLKNLFNEIICWNGKIKPILSYAIQNPTLSQTAFTNAVKPIAKPPYNDINFLNSCWNFVNYQYQNDKLCNGNPAIFATEGFQIGSPWHGDVVQAPVLFLGSNPGITHRCFFPHWHPARNVFTDGNPTMTTDTVNNVDIYNFLTTRLFNTHIDNGSGNPDAYVFKNDGELKNKGGVPHWQGMRYIMDKFSNGLNLQYRNNDNVKHTQGLMHSVLSSEVIFWGSQGEQHAKDSATLQYFWNHFVVPLLQNCGVRIIFLLGGEVQKTFDTCTDLGVGNGSFINVKNLNGNFTIVTMPHPSNYANFSNLYDTTIHKLLNSDIPSIKQTVRETLKKIKKLY